MRPEEMKTDNYPTRTFAEPVEGIGKIRKFPKAVNP